MASRRKVPSVKAQRAFVAAVDDRTARVRLALLIAKLQQTIPFPLNLAVFYEKLLPEAFTQYTTTLPVTPQHRNLMRAVSTHSVVHVELDPESYFRIEMPCEVVVPHTSNREPFAAFMFSEKDPLYPEVKAWFDKAQAFDWKLQAMHRMMKDTMNGGPYIVAGWPNFAKVIRAPHGRPTRKAMEELDLIATPEQRDEFDALMAQAVLLPELTKPHAWISHSND